MDNLKILILEDSRDDVDLIERELKRGGIAFTSVVVNRKHEFENALKSFKPDVILSDHSLPQFNSIEALKLYKERQKELQLWAPFILITGAVSEEFAVQCIKSGADDYILKDRLKKLPFSILSALEKTKMESERMKFLHKVMENEALMKEAEHLASFGSWNVDLLTGKHKWSDECYRIFGYVPGEIEPSREKFLNHVHPDDKNLIKNNTHEAIRHLTILEGEFRIIDKNGETRYLHSKIVVHRNHEQKAVRLMGFNLDITEQRKQTKALEGRNLQLMEIAWVQSHEVRAPLARMMGLINLMQGYQDDEMSLKEVMNNILISANEVDTIIRRIVRKTEEIKGNED